MNYRDDAGEITAVADRVSPNFIFDHISEELTKEDAQLNLSANADRCLLEYGAISALSCVRIPYSSLSY